ITLSFTLNLLLSGEIGECRETVSGDVPGIRILDSVNLAEVPVVMVIRCAVNEQLYGRSRDQVVFRRAQLAAYLVVGGLSWRKRHRYCDTPAGYRFVSIGLRRAHDRRHDEQAPHGANQK